MNWIFQLVTRIEKIVNWLIDFNGRSTHLGLFYASRLENSVQLNIHNDNFCVAISKEFFFRTRLYDIYQVFQSNTNNLQADLFDP